MFITARFLDNDNFMNELDILFKNSGFRNAVVVSSVGGLKECDIRMPGAVGHVSKSNRDIRSFKGEFEIISMNGTIDKNGKKHIHVSFSGIDGNLKAGHLVRLVVRNTAEVTLATDPTLVFERKPDGVTGFDELTVRELR